MSKTAFGLALLLLTAPLAAEELTLDAIFARQPLTGPEPTQARWSPNGRFYTFILERRGSEERDLWIVDAETGEKRILLDHQGLSDLAPSVEQATADERERERLRRYSVAGYLWSPDSESLLFVSSGRLFLWELESRETTALAPEKSGVRDPKFSPDGERIAFVAEHDLWTAPLEGGRAQRLTSGGTADLLHGDPDWVYQEEFAVRTAYHWSPDSRRIAFLEFDERSVPQYPLTTLTTRHATVDLQRYPQPGDPNPNVRIGVVDASRKRPRVRWFAFDAEYLPRLGWIDADTLWVQTLNRGQNELKILSVDVRRDERSTLHVERDEYWINVDDDLRFLKDGRFLWTSERTGFRHIYLHEAGGTESRRLTSGDWEVQEIEAVDEDSGRVYFTANRGNVIGSDLWSVGLGGGEPERETSGSGTHRVVVNAEGSAYVDNRSSLNDPGDLVLIRRDGASVKFHERAGLAAYDLKPPKLETIEAPDGATIRIQLYEPEDLKPGSKRPLIVYVYGGPHAPTIRDAFDGRRRGLFHHWLTRNGYAVAQIDDRASSIPGHKYEALLNRAYGTTALADQLVAVEHLARLDYVDPDRIGVWGWSGGGMATCLALTQSDRFRAGVAGAPVTDWHLYDSIYTERYMGLPADEPEAYKKTSCVESAADLSGRLMLIHGTADDNVHPQNTIQMIDALIEAGKPYDLLLYPDKTHGVAGETAQRHVFRSIAEFFDLHLKRAD